MLRGRGRYGGRPLRSLASAVRNCLVAAAARHRRPQPRRDAEGVDVAHLLAPRALGALEALQCGERLLRSELRREVEREPTLVARLRERRRGEGAQP